MNRDALLFLLVVASGASMTVAVRSLALKLGIVNNPNPIVPQHTKPIAYLGGVGVLLGIVLGLVWIQILGFQDQGIQIPIGPTKNSTSVHSMFWFWSGGFIFLSFGVIDDLLTLKPLQKFIGQSVIAATLVSLGIKTSYFGRPILDSCVSVFWIVAVVNAVNFTDVCDGLVGTIAGIAFLSAATLTPEIRDFCLLISASTFGFLFFNFPRASIFLGDAGSHLLGYFLAVIGLIGGFGDTKLENFVWMVLVAGVPLFELIFITIVRIHRGIPWWRGSPDHFSLRMQAGGFKRITINILAGLATLIFVLLGHFYSAAPSHLKLFIVISATSACLFFSKTLMQWEVRKSK